MNTKFVIISHGRTASTALCDGLNVNPEIICAYELFGPDNQKTPNPTIKNYKSGSGAEYLMDFYGSIDKSAKGFKLFTFHARATSEQLTAWQYLISQKDTFCIVLSRRDLLASFLSEQRAKHTGKWHPSKLGDNKNLESKFYVDPSEAERYLYRVFSELTWVKNKFLMHPMLELYYEDLQIDFESVIKKVSEFLGVKYCCSGIRFDSLLGDNFESSVQNYSELTHYLNHTIFSRSILT